MASTQAQGKGKKKNKEVTKVSLEEFNQIDAPHGHSVVSLKTLDWAETMADYEQHATETQQIIVPALPRAQRGPGVDFDSLPDEPPFRVDLYGLPLGTDEKEIKMGFFRGIEVEEAKNYSKTCTTVTLATKQDLYDALCKDGVSVRGRTINVCLYGQVPENNYQDRYGGRGGNTYGDRYGDRGGQGGSYGARMGDRYNDRGSGGGFGRDRDSYTGYNRGGVGGYREQRAAYGDKFGSYERPSYRDAPRSYGSGVGEPVSEPEPDNWRTAARPTPPAHVPPYNNGARQPYMHSRQEQSYYPPHNHQAPPHNHQESSYQSRYQPHHNQSSNMPSSQYNDRPGPNRTMGSAATTEQRPKLVIKPRQTPINVDDVSTVSRNESIFGQAKPSSKPYEKILEVEQKLSTVQISDVKTPSQSGSQPGSAPRSRQISERSSRD